ncbi:hypothetical protein Arub01_47700 [Actinomadura rubrobrunea]|uniref:Uncharacterized protein n=1 Tax=Actinomadura rubrobrunea TaxID=115335 RepID=A0A9W6UWB5_9ACTN|nr:hypothetical protein Arub01_47700 [Actinomadura rubrobrunea]
MRTTRLAVGAGQARPTLQEVAGSRLPGPALKKTLARTERTRCGTRRRATGVGNGSTYRMIPAIFQVRELAEADRGDSAAAERAPARARLAAAAAIGLISAVGADGGVLIQQTFRIAQAMESVPRSARCQRLRVAGRLAWPSRTPASGGGRRRFRTRR